MTVSADDVTLEDYTNADLYRIDRVALAMAFRGASSDEIYCTLITAMQEHPALTPEMMAYHREELAVNAKEYGIKGLISMISHRAVSVVKDMDRR